MDVKTPPSAVGESAIALAPSRFADYLALTKPRIGLLVMLCAAVGFVVGSGGLAATGVLIHVVLGTAILAAGGAALNQYREREFDALMQRTDDRPLPSGRLFPWEALLLGLSLTIGGSVYLAATVNPLTMVLGLSSAVLYVLVYTPMKRTTPWCIFVGAVAGAVPPVMGFTAATGRLTWEAAALFGILFAWQLPHFLSIAWIYRDDYDRAGYAMSPLVGREGGRVIRRVFMTSVFLAAVTLLPAVWGMGGFVYLVGASSVCALMLLTARRWRRDDLTTYTRRVFGVSLAYLPAILIVLALCQVWKP